MKIRWFLGTYVQSTIAMEYVQNKMYDVYL